LALKEEIAKLDDMESEDGNGGKSNKTNDEESLN
jgi:hypothetical protein